MKQLTVLVTSDGGRVLPEGDEFFAALGSVTPGGDPVGFAVGKLGFIKFRVLDDRVTEIELHAGNVDHRALLTAECQIGEVGTRLFRIKYLDTGRHSETALSAAAAIARLRELRAPPATPAAAKRFHAQSLDCADLQRDPANPMYLLSQKWRGSFGRFDSTVFAFADRNGLTSRLMVVGVGSRSTEPVFRFIGEALFPWLDDYQMRAIGEPLDSFPDKRYGAWLSGFYKSVGASAQPRFDRVTARLHLAGSEATYLAHYDRLLLPWWTAAGETVVSASARRIESAVPAPA